VAGCIGSRRAEEGGRGVYSEADEAGVQGIGLAAVRGDMDLVRLRFVVANSSFL
jgi:hypothetical protein